MLVEKRYVITNRLRLVEPLVGADGSLILEAGSRFRMIRTPGRGERWNPMVTLLVDGRRDMLVIEESMLSYVMDDG